jgi:hypothetical protein
MTNLILALTFSVSVYFNVLVYNLNKPAILAATLYCHIVCVIIDGVWVGEWIY